MARKFLTSIDINQNELIKAVIQNSSTDPGSGRAGQVYYNTSDDVLKVYSGTASAWVAVGSSEYIGDTVANLLAAGDGIFLNYDDPADTLTITNTGVTSVLGTNSEIEVSASAGNVTIGLPDNVVIGTGLTIGDLPSPTAIFDPSQGGVIINEPTDINNTLDVTGTASFGDPVNVNATISTSSALFQVPLDVNSNADISGTLAVGASAQFGSDVEIDGNLVIDGNLTVSGSTTYINTETVTIDDNIVLFNADQTGTPVVDAGIEIERGDLANSSLFWDESEEEWAVSNGSANYAISLEGHTHVSSDITNFSNSVQGVMGNTLADSSTIDFEQSPIDNSIRGNIITSGSASYLSTANGLEVDKAALETALVADSFTRKYSETIGDGVNNTFDVTHNLSTRDVTVQVYDIATYETVEVDISRSTTSKIAVTFAEAPASNSYRVVVVG
jgi:hypothetical protein